MAPMKFRANCDPVSRVGETKLTSILFLSIALGAIHYQSLKGNENERDHQNSP
jgi:hypothetical protein